jgi:hypothetical protein
MWIWVRKLGFTATFWHLIYLVYFQELTLLSLVRVLVDTALTLASAVSEPALGDAVAAFSQPTRNMWLLCDCIHSCPALWNKTVTRTIWKQLLPMFKKELFLYATSTVSNCAWISHPSDTAWHCNVTWFPKCWAEFDSRPPMSFI